MSRVTILRRWVCLALAILWGGTYAMGETVRLSDNWLVQSAAIAGGDGCLLSKPDANTSGWLRAKVPSTVMGVLMANGQDSCSSDSWWYRTVFPLPSLKGDEHVLLQFDGISYRADIWLNGRKIAGKEQTYGPFRQFCFDITDLVGENNALAVEVFKAQPGEPNIGYVDWNPRPADESMGLFREVSIKRCRSVAVGHAAVCSRVNKATLDEAWVTIDAELTNLSDKVITGELRGCIEGMELSKPITLQPGEQRIVTLATDVHLEHPRLWWCHHLGSPELYALHMDFLVDGTVSDATDVNFGIREIESYLTADGHRGFKLNGRKVLIRGAGWTDDLYLRDSEETNRRQLEYVRDMNLNTIRLEGFWGNSQSLYDLCDQMGILILVGWSCHWEWEDYLGKPCDERYGGIVSPEDMSLIGQSFKDQVLYLRHHPAIIGWFVGSDMLPKPELERSYQQFLSGHDDRPYIVSAKSVVSEVSGPSGMKMAGPYEYVSPSYWYDPQAPGGAFGFNTETGIGAQLPVRESLEKMLGGQLLPIDNRWNALCTASTTAMNSLTKLTEVINARFGQSTDIDAFLHRADLLNYESTRAMFEAFRLNEPRSTGIIQWMLNAARPSIYWQLYDYYGQPNAAYYAVKHGNESIQLIYDYRHRTVCAVNETLVPATIKASMHLIGGTGDYRDTLLTIVPGDVVKVFDIDSSQSSAFLLLKASDHNNRLIASNDYYIPVERDEYDWQKGDWVTTPISRYADYSDLDTLPKAVCEFSTRHIEGGSGLCYEVTIHNTSPVVAFFIRLAAKDADGSLICPAFWSDNYLTLAPGEKRLITCTMPSLRADETVGIAVEGWNTNIILQE